MIIVQKDNDVNFKLNFEVCCFQGRAGEQPGKHHVYRNWQAPADIPISNLNILYLGGISGIPFRAPWWEQEIQREGKERREHSGQNLEQTYTGAGGQDTCGQTILPFDLQVFTWAMWFKDHRDYLN